MKKGVPVSDPVLALRASVLALTWLVLVDAPGLLAQPSSEAASDKSEVLYSASPAAWYEAYFVNLAVAPDGGRGVFNFRELIDLSTGREMAVEAGLDAVFLADFDPLGRLFLAGERGEERGWFRVEDEVNGEADAVLLDGIPLTRWVSWAPAGDRAAYWVGSSRESLFITSLAGPTEAVAHEIPGRPTTFTWLPGGTHLLLLIADDLGLGTVYRLDPQTSELETIAAGLDIPFGSANLAVSGDGRFAYLALAGDATPDPEVRHVPIADRDLDIYELDLASGTLRAVVATPAEELAPVFADGALHWIAIETRQEVVLVPARGGTAAIVVADGAQLPYWRPDSRAIGVTFGDWRLADWALNLDGGVIEVDPYGTPTSPLEPLVVGYHEDFSPVWSPDGRWIAYHSHRSPTPVAGYWSEGSSDDIYVRRPEAPTSEEIRLTDFGSEVGSPDWAPDGRRVLIDSHDEDGGSTAWIIEMDPETGAPTGRTPVPAPGADDARPVWGAWSPVREEVALVLRTASGAELWTLVPDGSGARRLTSYPGPWHGGVDWSPDGEFLVYGALADDRVQLFEISRSGGDPRRLSDEPANLLHPQVSPDGRWIAATRIRHVQQVLRTGL